MTLHKETIRTTSKGFHNKNRRKQAQFWEAKTEAYGTPKTMIELEANDCRYPIGDPQDSDFHFCGGKTQRGETSCDDHEKMCRQ